MTCQNTFSCLYIIAKIRRYLSQNPAKTTVHAYITSHLEYFNVLLRWSPYISDKSDKQTSTRREFCSSPCHTFIAVFSFPCGMGGGGNITPIPRRLHWLSVRFRSIFKILLLTYKALSGLTSSFTRDLLRRWNMALFIICKTLRKEGRAFQNIGKNIYIPDCKISLTSFVLYFQLLLIRSFIRIRCFSFVSWSLLQKQNSLYKCILIF